MCKVRSLALVLACAVPYSLLAGSPKTDRPAERSQNQQRVSGPTRTMNEALAAGATAIISVQPVPPKTVPPSNYPMGTVIMNETIYLGSVPARVWLEGRVTGWAPEIACFVQMGIDGDDIDGDGGGFDGDNADCNGVPIAGAGDLVPAIVPCTTTAQCRAALSGRTSACFAGEPNACAGGFCPYGFIDGCDPKFVAAGLANIFGFESGNLHPRWFVGLNEPDDVNLNDFGPSYTGTMVLDVPANAKGRYVIDYWEEATILLSRNPPPNHAIPIAELRAAVISVDTCASHMDCDDGSVCTIDSCQGGCCEHSPIAGWNPATECCNPASGEQAPIPQSTSCRTGGCSLGGSSGTPTYSNLPDGTVCASDDPCFSGGECIAGQCVGEQYAGSDCPKPRFISFDVSTGPVRAYRVRLVSLHHPNPPYARGVTADFSAYEGEVRWVGPHSHYSESTADPTAVYASMVQCQPHYQNWNSLYLLHVTGAEIVPSSIYEVQSIAQGLDINVESNYSAPITIKTARWADVIIPYSPPNATAQPNAGDHSALVTKFRSINGAMSKPRALLSGEMMTGIPNLQNDIGFVEISLAVDAYRGFGYPYAGPQACP